MENNKSDEQREQELERIKQKIARGDLTVLSGSGMPVPPKVKKHGPSEVFWVVDAKDWKPIWAAMESFAKHDLESRDRLLPGGGESNWEWRVTTQGKYGFFARAGMICFFELPNNKRGLRRVYETELDTPEAEAVIRVSQGLVERLKADGFKGAESFPDPFAEAETEYRRGIVAKALQKKKGNPHLTWEQISQDSEIDTPVRTLAEWRSDPRYKP